MKRVNTIPFPFALDNMFSDFFKPEQEFMSSLTGVGKEALNIEEYQDHFLLQVIAPGYEKQHFSVDLEKNILTVEAKASVKENQAPMKTIRRDYTTDGFKRTFHVENDKIAAPSMATYQNGILSIVMPKLIKEESAKKTIAVQ